MDFYKVRLTLSAARESCRQLLIAKWSSTRKSIMKSVFNTHPIVIRIELFLKYKFVREIKIFSI